jgi:glycosyltransferase involved in cell wall biosynthesis
MPDSLNINMKRLSIIVPVYNVEKYIEKCISSVINSRHFSECCELVVVDDGSPDGSIALVKELCGSNPSVKIHRQSNQGLGAARNAGAKLATGEYIWFVDSDDWITDSAIEDVLNLTEKTKVDVVCLYHVMSSGAKSKFLNNAIPGKVYSGLEYLSLSCVQSCAPFYIFRRDFYEQQKLSFLEGVYHEDTLFTPVALYCASSVVLLPEPCYVYNLRDGSIMTSGNTLRHAKDMLIIVKKLEEFRKSRATKRKEKSVLAYYSSVAIGAVYYYWKQLPRSGKREVAKEWSFIFALPPILRGGALKYSVAAFLISLSKYGRAEHRR